MRGDPSFAVVKFAVALGYFADHPAGIADGNAPRGDILCHNASRTDHGILPNGNTRHHDHASTQPTVATDADGQIVLVCFLPQFRQDRVVKEFFSFFSRVFQILSVLCRTDTILFLEYPAKIEWVIIPYDLCNFSNIVFGVLQ